ncbi:hypothetical protein BDZ97DRAFT_1793708 [Flammula alnicola]|nr:hypothetical protein BDZ97DRAFT_1793708 [Flammula alnicola]
MQLVGAAVITAQGNSQTCVSITGAFPSLSSFQESPCASSQVLQAFTWICAILRAFSSSKSWANTSDGSISDQSLVT